MHLPRNRRDCDSSGARHHSSDCWIILPFASLGILIVWIIALVKALKGERYQLPIIGKYAAQQAGA